MNTKLSESNGEPCTWRHVSTVRGQALENLPSKDGKALSAEPTLPASIKTSAGTCSLHSPWDGILPVKRSGNLSLNTSAH